MEMAGETFEAFHRPIFVQPQKVPSMSKRYHASPQKGIALFRERFFLHTQIPRATCMRCGHPCVYLGYAFVVVFTEGDLLRRVVAHVCFKCNSKEQLTEMKVAA
jgi:hypothetical protein